MSGIESASVNYYTAGGFAPSKGRRGSAGEFRGAVLRRGAAVLVSNWTRRAARSSIEVKP
ncbi:MAG TPA: hypothetical protein VNF29_15775 [Candidatus Binataceae bacterium]|nr:hypothetical protein [Candidatus Binataceae bacterium]